MPLDPTIALHAGDAVANVQQGNPLLPQNLGPLVGLANAAKELQAKNAAAQVYQGAVSPEGNVDTNKLIAGFSQGPASFMAGPLIRQALENQGAQIQQQNARRGILQNSLSSLLQDQDLSLDKVNANISTLVQQGIITPQMALQEGKSFLGKEGKFDASQARLRLTEHLINVMTPEQREGFLFGRPTIVGSGDQQHMMMLGPNGAQTLASVRMGLSPEAAISQQPGGVTPSGAPTLVPGVTRAGQVGVPATGTLQSGSGVAPGGGPAAARRPAASQGASLGSGRYTGSWDPDSLMKLSPAARQSWLKTATEAQKEQLREALRARIGGAAQPQ
jgi:hypothetical protein